MHPDHDEGRLRRDLHEGRKGIEARNAQHGLLDDDDGRPQPPEQPDHVGEISGRGERLDSRLALEQLPQRGSEALVARSDEDRDVRRFSLEGGLRHRQHYSTANGIVCPAA